MKAQQKATTPEAKALRKKGGQMLKKLRSHTGMTQRELADAVGLEYYTFISQMETGSARIPPEKYEEFAKAYGVPTAWLAKRVLMYYDPYTYRAIWGAPQPTEYDLDEVIHYEPEKSGVADDK